METSEKQSKNVNSAWLLLAVFIIAFLIGIIGALSYLGYLRNDVSDGTNGVSQIQNTNTLTNKPTAQITGTILYQKYGEGTIELYSYDTALKQERLISSIAPAFDRKKTIPNDDNLREAAQMSFAKDKIFYVQSNADASKVELFTMDPAKGYGTRIFQFEADKGQAVSAEYSISPNNKAVVVVSSMNPAERARSAFEDIVTQIVFIVDITNGQTQEVNRQKTDIFSGFTPLALSGNFLYLAESYFESSESFIRMNIENSQIENLSERLNFSFSSYHLRLSPNGKTLAMSALSNTYGITENTIAFVDMATGSVTPSALISGCNGEFPGGFNCFSDLTWFPDSSSVYAATENIRNGHGQGGAEKAYQITPDGKVRELPFVPRFDILEILSKDSAMAVLEDTESKISSLGVISLENGDVLQTVLPNFEKDLESSLMRHPSFLGML